jgi:hypothetical protein
MLCARLNSGSALALGRLSSDPLEEAGSANPVPPTSCPRLVITNAHCGLQNRRGDIAGICHARYGNHSRKPCFTATPRRRGKRTADKWDPYAQPPTLTATALRLGFEVRILSPQPVAAVNGAGLAVARC